MIGVGLLLYYGPWAVIAAVFWLGVRWWARRLNSYDAMDQFRADRADVARTERALGVAS